MRKTPFLANSWLGFLNTSLRKTSHCEVFPCVLSFLWVGEKEKCTQVWGCREDQSKYCWANMICGWATYDRSMDTATCSSLSLTFSKQIKFKILKYKSSKRLYIIAICTSHCSCRFSMDLSYFDMKIKLKLVYF